MRKRKRLGFGQFLILVIGILSALVIWAAWEGFRFFKSEFPDVGVLKTHYPRVVYKGKDEPFQIRMDRSRPGGWTTLNEISRSVVGAIVVSEDWAFYQHKGYDPNQIREAIKEDLQAGRFARGASTITQQVVKNVFLTREKTIWRKLKELYLATELEEKVTKKKILETYLNIAEWGEGIFGIRAAARTYFDKSPSELNPKEGAFLAMLLPSPKRYSQSFRQKKLTPYARRIVSNILTKMMRARYLTPEEREIYQATPLSFEAIEDIELPELELEPEPELDPEISERFGSASETREFQDERNSNEGSEDLTEEPGNGENEAEHQ